MEKIITIVVVMMLLFTMCVACDDIDGTRADTLSTQEAAEHLQSNQPTPTDISYSLERYNLIRRAYWVNGQREKANTLPCEIQKPLGYIVLFSGNTVVNLVCPLRANLYIMIFPQQHPKQLRS